MASDRHAPHRTDMSSLRHHDTIPGEILRWLIRARGYFLKEVREIRRQPLLIASLIGGPLLVLVLFGIGFVNSNPVLHTALLLPDDLPADVRTRLIATVRLNFTLSNHEYTADEARAALARGDLDVVQIVPRDIFTGLQRGENPTIQVYSNAINPLIEGWIQYLAYAQVNEINKALLTEQMRLAQQQARSVSVQVALGAERLTELEGQVGSAERAMIQRDLHTLRDLIMQLRDMTPPNGMVAGQGDEIQRLRTTADDAVRSLDHVNAILDSGSLERGLAEIRESRELLALLEQQITIFVSIAPETIVSPLQHRYQNIRTEGSGQASGAYPAVVYYAPGVLALLVQHTAVSLGALALVRERLMGAFELFRVAPATMVQLLIGKYLSYTLVITLLATVLTAAMRLLGVPLLGNWQFFAVLLLLLTLASLGVGFLISTIARSDSQAIQYAMITLLLSIFFSGFFISRDSFAGWITPVVAIIPMSHGVAGFQALMLRGTLPGTEVWLELALIASVTFALVAVLLRRQFRAT